MIRLKRCLSLLILFAPAYAHGGSYEVIDRQSHGKHLFTQGLILENEELFISSGLYHRSFIEVQNIKNNTQRSRSLPKNIFAEGLTLFRGNLYLLTWKAGRVYIYNPESLEKIGNFRYFGEGWGLTNNDQYLIRSDGSHRLHFHSPTDFTLEKTIEVTREGKAVWRLNELEFAEGYIWANVWKENKVYKIDPASGKVIDDWNLSSLTQSLSITDPNSVLNGIAYDKNRKAFWLTGKRWPKRYLIKLKAASDA